MCKWPFKISTGEKRDVVTINRMGVDMLATEFRLNIAVDSSAWIAFAYIGAVL